MRLQRAGVDWYVCHKCGRGSSMERPLGEAVADLDGEPWKAYYCPDCVQTEGWTVEQEKPRPGQIARLEAEAERIERED